MPNPNPPSLKPLRRFGVPILVLIALLSLVFLLFVRPKPLDYTVDAASVRGFDLAPGALTATFDLTLRAYNRDRWAWARYTEPVEVTVWYDGQIVAFAEVVPFRQPRRNVTTLQVSAAARGTPLLGPVEERLERDRATGEAQVEVRVRARVRMKAGRPRAKEYLVEAYCSPVVVHFSEAAAAAHSDEVYCDVDMEQI